MELLTESTNLLSMNSLVNFTSGRDIGTEVELQLQIERAAEGVAETAKESVRVTRVQLCLPFQPPMTAWLSGSTLFDKILVSIVKEIYWLIFLLADKSAVQK